jgi:hypothetical protein
LAAVLSCGGTAAGGENVWESLREEGRVAYFLNRSTAAPDSTGKSIVKLKRVFRAVQGKQKAPLTGVELDCSGKPMPRRDRSDMAYSLDTVEIDCRRGLYRFTEITIHDREGDVVRRYRPIDQFCPVPPASSLDAARSRACR